MEMISRLRPIIGIIEGNWEALMQQERAIFQKTLRQQIPGDPNSGGTDILRYGILGGQPVAQRAYQPPDLSRPLQQFPPRGLTDPREELAFASRADSKAVGALAGIRGAIEDEIDLGQPVVQGGIIELKDAPNEHSGQFNWNI